MSFSHSVEDGKCIPRTPYGKNGVGFPCVEMDEWIPSPEPPGYLVRKRWRPLGEVGKNLNAALKSLDMLPDEYGMNLDTDMTPDTPCPEHRWIACFAVEGGSEGWYIHVDALTGDHRIPLFLGKTFQGMDRAYEVARTIAKILGA